jgi:hypothetical protein
VISEAARARESTVGDFIREMALAAAEFELASRRGATDLVEVARSLDALRAQVKAAIKSEVKASA